MSFRMPWIVACASSENTASPEAEAGLAALLAPQSALCLCVNVLHDGGMAVVFPARCLIQLPFAHGLPHILAPGGFSAIRFSESAERFSALSGAADH
jgi:hypothetical protein